MIGRGEARSRISHAGDPFLERVRRALDHDLRTPLGTIVNYASILECQTDAKPEDVRIFAARIRSNAVRIAKMLRHVADAVTLSGRLPSDPGVDPSALVRALGAELGLHMRFPAQGTAPADSIPVDRDLLAFAWRAFLSLNSQAGPKHALDADIDVRQSDGETAIDLWIGSRPTEATARVGSATFAEEDLETVPPESCFALDLAEALIRRRGGDFGLWGRPGVGARL